MILYTMGFTQKTAEQFFGLISANGIKLLIDIRLNNASQLAGFTKGGDLKYFLDKICGCGYAHNLDFAPTKEIMDAYKNGKITWDEYEKQYGSLIYSRKAHANFYAHHEKYGLICLLCSEPSAEQCHRGLLAAILAKEFPQIEIKHLNK